MGAGNWSRILKLGHNIYEIWLGRIFYIYPSFCVTFHTDDTFSRDFELARNVSCQESTVSPVRG